MNEAIWIVAVALLAGYLLRDRSNEKLNRRKDMPGDKFSKGESRYLDIVAWIWIGIMVLMIAFVIWVGASVVSNV
jgi:uncharacterized SAM-binding protein YcdF (DUF218 family)